MDKKKLIKSSDDDNIKGFEEFIEGQSNETSFLPKGVGGSKKNEAGFENFTFLVNDGQRLMKVKNLLSDKLPFTSKFDQGDKLIKDLQSEILVLRKNIFEICDQKDSTYRKSVGEIFNSYFDPAKQDTP